MKRRAGFTLIEVLICTAILSASLIIVYKPMLTALNTLRYGDEREEADRLLERQIFEFREKMLKSSGLVAPSETRTLLGRDKPFEYRRVAKPLTDDGELYRVECQISWKRAGTLKRLIRSFDAYIPKYSAA
ncbi:MAG: prepilin-type N-terminal cleavage/methylation domain-containing protein [Candidatus Omnitrophica bacterium]|nr:prepilin-type N-terminal cleavage/methylation domain-containing protein [Candidatus Omnitrophota bacterium]